MYYLTILAKSIRFLSLHTISIRIPSTTYGNVPIGSTRPRVFKRAQWPINFKQLASLLSSVDAPGNDRDHVHCSANATNEELLSLLVTIEL